MLDVFTAVADPTRRSIMERLREEGPLTVTELAAGFPMSRQAVTKHLDHLICADLVSKQVSGRERVHTLRSAPLREVEEWLAPYSAA